ncbi:MULTISPECIES: hybrid sensor histidine kinase/response regulator [unclassified Caballeronia]|uniref:hybrid sensor histidine kinase/response regulator n=1 Tax=unclassified Caballeronia TaxID=2646786 RepID=UPI0020292EE2|nr:MULTISPECIES: hybrid sensor histidine kinase/response regulator [unclassified Caballeronia]
MAETERCPVLLLTPSGRDCVVAQALLGAAGIDAEPCKNVAQLGETLRDDVCCVIVADEALNGADLATLAGWVSSQPPWSDLPFVVLTQRSGPVRRPMAERLITALGNVTFIERPFHPTTFVSVVETAVRGRNRQFEARARIRELDEGEAHLRIALTAGHLGSWSLDLSSNTLTASTTCKAIFGRLETDNFTYEELIASTHPEDRERVQAAIAVSAETGCDYAIEYRNVWRNGTVHWVEVRARVVHDDRIVRLVGVCSDVTLRKTSEDQLRRVNESLEVKVLERTAQLEDAHRTVLEEIRQREHTEKLLRQVQKLEMIGQLTGGIAHDFNNLLMAIMANLELVRKEVPPEERVGRLVDGALKGAQRGAALTQRLLAFARQQVLKVEPVQMSALVHGMADLLDRSIGSMIELVIDTPEEVPFTRVDTNQIELAILNLVVNARDAMPDGGAIQISVDTAHSAGDGDLRAGDYVRVTVRDTGTGMDAATLAKATEPFFTTKEVGKGTGLGLSMIHGLARQLQGALRLESTYGKGTRASLWLPVTGRPAAEERIADDPKDDGPADASELRATVLVVDDDPLILSSTSYLLQDLGHEVIEAASGDAALQVLRAGQKVDVLLTDFSMPKMTGVELANAARALRPVLPVILATGYAELPEGTGADLPRLRKPYQQSRLLQEIRNAVKSLESPQSGAQ